MPLPIFLVGFLKENLLTQRKKVNDLLIDDDASWLKFVEKLDETKSLRLVNSAIADALVARDRAGLGVSDILANLVWDWLDTFESVVDGEILWAEFAMVFSDAGKDEHKNWVSNLVNTLEVSAVFNLHYAQAGNSHSACHILAQ